LEDERREEEELRRFFHLSTLLVGSTPSNLSFTSSSQFNYCFDFIVDSMSITIDI